jgi:hypothetical protein
MMSTAPSARQRFFLAALAFVVVLITGYTSDVFLKSHPEWMIADDLILAIAVSVVVFLYEKERGRILSERLRVIRDMNAFVRNELQVLYACLDHPEKARVPTIERSVERIDWALRELLPGVHIRSGTPVEEISERSRDAERSA